MPQEIRYATPYLSGLRWRLNPIKEGTPVQDAQGNQLMRIDKRDRGLTVEIIPYVAGVVAQTRVYEFNEQSQPTVDEVLSSTGVDVAAAWQAALDSMANEFPILQDPPPEQSAAGLPYYLRLDSWNAVLPYEGAKSVTAIIGLYEDPAFKRVGAYVPIVFADSATVEQRQSTRQSLERQRDEAEAILADPTAYPGWADLSEDDQQRVLEQARMTRDQAVRQIATMDAQLVGSLAPLFADPTVQQSIGALVQAVFMSLKESRPEWSQIDVAALMSRFALPEV
ncbi:MAG: hypothetical protein KatS3mg109_0041 [Pirellulaceae bacterium]|nr:MAG: hypothetical protein KatS3mg109_0041 [Pirellulaceae bacterium]